MFDYLPSGWFIKMALRRLIAQWRAIATIIIGVMLTAVIGASMPLYTQAISQVGMEQRLAQSTDEDTNIFIRLGIRANEGDFATTRQTYNQAINETINQAFASFGDWRQETVEWIESVSMFTLKDGEEFPALSVQLAYYAGLDRYATLQDGRWPQATAEADIEIVINNQVAETLNLAVGDALTLEQRGWDSSRPINAVISGVFTVDDPQDIYWLTPSPMRISRSDVTVETNVFSTQTDTERIINDFLPDTRAQIGWRILFAHDQLPFTQIAAAREQLNGLETALEDDLEALTGERVSLVYQTDLSAILGSYEDEIGILNAPFGMLLLQLAALSLFFLIVMGALVRRSERREIGMLKSRGVRNQQIILLRGIESAIICLIAVIVAPFIAQQTLLFMLPIITDVDNIPLSIDFEAYLFAGLASFAALIILVVTLIPILRSPLVLTAGSAEREQGQVWWQRYYLDVILLIIGLAAMSQLVNSGTLFAVTPDGEQQTDPLLLLVPTLLVIALGSVSLRIFPRVMHIAATFFNRQRNVEATLASWQVSREPLHYGRIAFLLALAISIGWFAISFQQTVVQNQADRAAYSVGADLRIAYEPVDTASTLINTLPNEAVQQATTVIRVPDVPSNVTSFGLDTATIIGIDNASFAATLPLSDNLGDIIPSEGDPIPQVGRLLSEDIAQIQFWGVFRRIPTFFNSNRREMTVEPFGIGNDSMLSLQLRIRDATGQRYFVPINADYTAMSELFTELYPPPEEGEEPNNELAPWFELITPEELPDGGWVSITADLNALDATYPLTWEGIVVETENIGVFGGGFTDSQLLLRDFVALDEDGNSIPLDWRDGWQAINQSGFIAVEQPYPAPEIDEAYLAESLIHNWQQQGDASTFGLMLDYPTLRYSADGVQSTNQETLDNDIVGIPAIVSESFAEENGFEVGQRFRLYFSEMALWFTVEAISPYFPTLYQDETPFIVVNRDILTYMLDRRPTTINRYEQEAWVMLQDDADTEAFVTSLTLTPDPRFEITDIQRTDRTLETLQTDLLSIGLIGLLFFSALVGFILSIVSMVTYSSLNVQDRRVEFAVLRAMGFSPRRIVASMAVEQGFVVVISLALGLGIGLLLHTQVLPVLSINTNGEPITPPFFITVNILTMILYALGILLILAGQIFVSSLLVRRLTTTQALRQPGE